MGRGRAGDGRERQMRWGEQDEMAVFKEGNRGYSMFESRIIIFHKEK
jgi:hypothetical protein